MSPYRQGRNREEVVAVHAADGFSGVCRGSDSRRANLGTATAAWVKACETDWRNGPDGGTCVIANCEGSIDRPVPLSLHCRFEYPLSL